MVIFGLSLSDIAFSLSILAPGYLVVTIASYIGKIDIGEDRLDRIIIMIISGVFCDSLFLILYSLYSGSEITRDSLNPGAYTLSEIAIAYASVFLIGAFLGTIIGLLIDRVYLRESQRRRDDVWDAAFDIATSDKENIEATVITTNGIEIRGYIRGRGTSNDLRDTLVEYPSVVIRDESRVLNELDIGRRVYISSDDVTHVFFHE